MPVAKIVSLHRTVDRIGRGSLAGQLFPTDDGDSAAVNESMARDFGLA